MWPLFGKWVFADIFKDLGVKSFWISCLVAKPCLTLCDPWTAAHQASLSFTISWSLLKFVSIESVMPSNHLTLCHPLLLLLIFPSFRVFSSESVLGIRWPKYWSFSFSINLSREYSGLISFRMEWLISLQSKRLYRVFFSTRVQKYLEEPEPWLDGPLLAK